MGLFDLFVVPRVEVERLGIISDDAAECLKITGGKCILPDKRAKVSYMAELST